MKGYFVNSDAVSNGNKSYHDEWISRGIAVTSGGPEYREQIDTISRGSTVLLHAKGFGVVAAGTVLDDCALEVKQAAGTVSPTESEEFHRKVAWYADLRTNPLPYSEVIRVWGTNPVRAVQPFVKAYETLLDLVYTRAEEADIAAIETAASTANTEIKALVHARRGQGQYREELLDLWERRCAVTGCGVLAVLRASHAKPWRVSTDAQRLDPNNGLPLIATLDALFDRGLIGFCDDGTMLYSPSLSEGDRRLFGVPAPLRKSLTEKQQRYLKGHRDAFGL